LGVPVESVKHDGASGLSAKTLTLVLAPAESPAGPTEKDQHRFYAKFVGDSVGVVQSVKGMSGGPIFAVRFVDEGWLYSVIGVQSGWFPADRVLIVCSFDWFATLLTHSIRSWQTELA
jgi:hypothetical protein